MKTIKIIDLLNKIAKGEEVPKKIKYEENEWVYNKNVQDYTYEKGIEIKYLIQEILKGYTATKELLFYKVEIIEEEKEIEKIKSNGYEFYSEYINVWIKKEETEAYCEYLMNKVNELIDVVNELKRDK